MKQIQGYDPVYFADELGNIYRSDRKMSPINNGIGYYQVKLRKDGKRHQRYVHSLIWETFNGSVPVGYEINHIDHDKSNNSLQNLELVTHSENLKKAVQKHGCFGFLKGSAKGIDN